MKMACMKSKCRNTITINILFVSPSQMGLWTLLCLTPKTAGKYLRSTDELVKYDCRKCGKWFTENRQSYSAKVRENLSQAGSVEEMDGVAGATISSRNFKKLIAHALANAQKGDKTAAVAPIFEESVVSGTDERTGAGLDRICCPDDSE